jgi:WD40 repeat protein
VQSVVNPINRNRPWLDDSGLTTLADELLLAARARRLLVVVDQFEGVFSVAFSPDGHTLATASPDDTTARLWETNVDRVAAQICSITSPTITTSEWNQYLPDLTYQPPCL